MVVLIGVVGPATQTSGYASGDLTAMGTSLPLTPLIYPVQSPCYKVPRDLIVPSPFIFPLPPPRHFDSLLPLPPCIVLLSNAIALYKHHLFRLSLLTTRRGCPQLSPTQPNRPFKDAIGKSPQSLRDCWVPAGYRWIDAEGTTAQPE